ncbi:hypothetical protein QJS10_CPA16g00714 [Acorus calamus]|uniref:Helicase C-terminal domain-containing protein n=1 Tax=Acorus calamus TaxID=4465 RepID=A0AAV9D2V1_ACOCL|nr:hypothetical protein QJS10_CPA16g00714 [Acorus calamus]
MLPRKQNIHFKGVKMSYEPRNPLGVKDLRCVIFVERVITAIVLQSLLSQVNIIVATQILEEGLDVQSCNLVIRFDPSTGVCSFI